MKIYGCKEDQELICYDYPNCNGCGAFIDKRKSTRYYSDKQEKRIAKKLNGKQQSNSGATTFQKGDVVADDWLIEAKTVTKQQASFTIKKEWLEKNKEEAFAMRRHYSALAFSFGDEEDYYVLDEKTFLKLLKAFREVNDG